jgi:KaiC/GvpD/RAD55 family RecA-like ATPase
VIVSGLQVGDSILVVATEAHRKVLVNELDRLEIDIRAAAREHRFTMMDAAETLSAFMRDGRPDRDLFLESMGKMIADAKRWSRSKGRGLTVFGEMVAVLWEEGNRPAALELETLWNEVMTGRAFHLHCAYPKHLFSDKDVDQLGLAGVCQQHSQVLIA